MMQNAGAFRGPTSIYFNSYNNNQFNSSDYNTNNDTDCYSNINTNNSNNSNNNNNNNNNGGFHTSRYNNSSEGSYATNATNVYSSTNTTPLTHHNTNTATDTSSYTTHNSYASSGNSYGQNPKSWGEQTSLALKSWDQSVNKPWDETSLFAPKAWDQMPLATPKQWGDQTSSMSAKPWGHQRGWGEHGGQLSAKTTWDQAALSAKSYFLSAYGDNKGSATGVSYRREATIGAYHEQYQYHTYGQPYHAFESSTLYLQRFASSLTSPTNGKQKRARMSVQKRLLVNARERDRMRVLNKAFESLRDALPCYISDGHMAKITTLRLAINYISALSELLSEDAKKNKNSGKIAPPLTTSSTSSTSQTSVVKDAKKTVEDVKPCNINIKSGMEQ